MQMDPSFMVSESRSNGVASWLVALCYAYVAFKAEAEGIVGNHLIQHLTSATVVDEAVAFSKISGIPSDSCFDDLFDIPIFQESFASSKTMLADTSSLTYILMDWLIGSYDGLGVSIFTNDAQIVVCLKVVTCGVPGYILFDSSRSRTNSSSEPSFLRAEGISQVAVFLQEALAITSLAHNHTDTDISAYLLRKKVKETHLSCLGAQQSACFPLSGDDLVCLPAIPEKPFVFHGPNYGSITSFGFARTSGEASSSKHIITDPLSNTMSKSRWQEYVWPLSLQSTPAASPESGSDDTRKQFTEPQSSKGRAFALQSEQATAPVASTSKKTENRESITTKQYSDPSYVSHLSDRAFRRSLVSSGKRASQKSAKEDNWETALLQQLQDEEEIASVMPSQTSEYTWLIALQKKLQAEDSGNYPPTSISPSELDWQLAVQLQQEVYQEENLENGTPRIVVESETNVHEGDSRPSQSTTQSGRLSVRQTYGDSFDSLNLYDHIPSQLSVQCGVCGDMHRSVDTVTLEPCRHSFCKDCLGHFVRNKIEERKYPIFCPECLVDRIRTAKTRILQDIIDKLGLTTEDRQKFCEIEINSHSIGLECPRCKERMNVDRDEYSNQTILVCPLPRCAHKWCRSCLKTVASSEERHRCKNGNIDRLMRRKGWKYCPGCRTPVQKESGCNHMTCGAPGCNVHFCYRCGVLMIDTTNGGDVGTAVTDHYNDCRLFERRFKCSIQ